jgi:hypothetical protein
MTDRVSESGPRNIYKQANTPTKVLNEEDNIIRTFETSLEALSAL